MRKYGGMVLLILGQVLAAGVIVENGKSDYAIAVPHRAGQHKLVTRYYREAAGELREVFKESTGAILPIFSEGDLPAGKPAIYIGATKRAMGLELDKLDLAPWETVTLKDGDDIILYGIDRLYRQRPKDYNDLLLGSIRAVALFMCEELKVRYLMPTASGRSVEKQSRIEFNMEGMRRRKPDFLYVSGRPNGLFYDLANHFLPMPFYGSYGGHSHNIAVSWRKYFDSNPEYFAVVKGKRNKTQVCLTNPEVVEMIYRNLLTRADEGYDWVQLAQSDGFAGCECPRCREFLGPETWGEKLWDMHRKMAERFVKDRPNKKVVILAYTVTRKPPEKFNRFPENVIIELCHYSKNDFDAWRKIEGIGGVVLYVYNWGYYKDEGFSPSLPPSFIPEQLQLFRDNKIMAIYRCGFGELFGLEGPEYYAYGQLAGNGNMAPEAALNEYCRRAFGPAAETMREFYARLYDRVDDGQYPEPDWSDFMYGITIKLYENQRLLAKRYPPEILAELDKLLSGAEQTSNLDEAQRRRLHLTRIEFDYLRNSAGLAAVFLKWLDAGKETELLPAVRQAFENRNKYIDSLYAGKDKVLYDGFSLFYSRPREMLVNGGRFRGLMKGAFSENFTPEKW